jgi:drug/metabolite transporter (DMT)-like permease
MNADRPVIGILCMLAFTALAPLMDASAKLASDIHSTGQITVARYLVQGAIVLPIALALRLSWRISPRDWGLLALRAVTTLGSTISFIAAITVMPLADALAIVFIEPFILMFMGWVFLGEQVGPRRILASGVGFIGAIIVVQPGILAFGYVALWPLAAGFFFAAYMLVTRQLRAHPPLVIQSATSGLALLMSVPLLFVFEGQGGMFDAVMPQGVMWFYLAGVGIIATVSHLFLTFALRLAPSATVAPLSYAEMAFATAVGFWVFGDFPETTTWVGVVLIVGSGLYLLHREHINARQASVQT